MITGFEVVSMNFCISRMNEKKSTIAYESYCYEFGIKKSIRPTGRRIIGIGRGRTGIVMVLIPIPFPKLGIIIKVELLLLKDTVPSLMCKREIIINDLEISIQDGRLATERVQPERCTTIAWRIIFSYTDGH